MTITQPQQKPYSIIPILQVRPTGLVTYPHFEWHQPRPIRMSFKNQMSLYEKASSGDINEIRKKAYSGEMSAGSIKRMKRVIQLLIASSEVKTAWHPVSNKEFKFRINFITLTLPAAQEQITDGEIRKQCLEPFLRVMRNKHGMKNYIWKAERQANGNLHYHITTDIFIHFGTIRDSWNKQLAKLGFIDRFAEIHGHHKPNSTDVHSVNNIDNLPGYLIKYMAKESTGLKPIDGKMWDCSLALKTKIKCEFEVTEKEGQYFDIMADTFSDQVWQESYVKMVRLSENELNSTLPDHMFEKYTKYLTAIRTGDILKWKAQETWQNFNNYTIPPKAKPRPSKKTIYKFNMARHKKILLKSKAAKISTNTQVLKEVVLNLANSGFNQGYA